MDGNTRFEIRTFAFLQVCRYWNEVAVGYPQLWGWWIPGAVKAWPLFNSRSKGTPIFLTWRSRLPNSARDILTDPAIPKRVRQLDFNGTSEQPAHLLGAFDTSPLLTCHPFGCKFPHTTNTNRENVSLVSSLRPSQNSLTSISGTSYPTLHLPFLQQPTSSR